MEQPAFHPFRSTSLPNPTLLNRSSLFESYTRRDSDCMLSDGPITPPLSPTRSEEGGTSIIVDSEPRYSGRGSDLRFSPRPSRPSTGHSRRQLHQMESENLMDLDPKPPATSPRPPLRHLEDEPSHADKGTLKLTDFEVKGTLGQWRSCNAPTYEL